MKFPRISLLALGLASAHADPENEGSNDILSFTNGDSLHGNFVDLTEGGVLWQRKGAEPANYALDDLRLIGFNHGQAKTPLKPTNLVHLVTGDVIPGEVAGLSEDSIQIKTEFAGEMSFSRDLVESFERIPGGGNLVFYGPFYDQDWTIVSSRVGPEDDSKPAWKFDSSAFYVQGVGFASPKGLELPDSFELNFRLSTREVSTLSIAFFADKEEFGDEGLRDEIKETRNNYYGDNKNAELYGSALVLDLIGSRAQLSEVIPAQPAKELEGEDGEEKEIIQAVKARNRRFGNSTSFTKSSRSFDIDVQLRASRTIGLVQLLVDGKHAGSWKMDPEDIPSGSLLKFGQRRGRLRFSDIYVSEWNQMPDSALSMQSRERDVVLMTSGTDRFSGKVIGFEGDALKVDTSFGMLSLESEDISKVVFASEDQSVTEEIDDHAVMLKMPMNGRIGGKIENKDGQSVFVSRFGAEWSLDSEYLNFIEFDDYDPNLEKWYE